MERRERQDLLSKLGAWEPWERVEAKGRGRKESGENMQLNISNLKKVQKKRKICHELGNSEAGKRLWT